MPDLADLATLEVSEAALQEARDKAQAAVSAAESLVASTQAEIAAALFSGDTGKAEAARADLDGSEAELARAKAWLADIDAQIPIVADARTRAQAEVHVGELADRIDDAERDLAPHVEAMLSALLALKSEVRTVIEREGALWALRLQHHELSAGLLDIPLDDGNLRTIPRLRARRPAREAIARDPLLYDIAKALGLAAGIDQPTGGTL